MILRQSLELDGAVLSSTSNSWGYAKVHRSRDASDWSAGFSSERPGIVDFTTIAESVSVQPGVSYRAVVNLQGERTDGQPIRARFVLIGGAAK